jgi:transposase-like protein
MAEGLYSSQITEWRRLRDAGGLEGKAPGERIGRPSPEQAEIARLTRELEPTKRRLAKTEVALDIMGKAHALGRDLRERTPSSGGPSVDSPPTTTSRPRISRADVLRR